LPLFRADDVWNLLVNPVPVLRRQFLRRIRGMKRTGREAKGGDEKEEDGAEAEQGGYLRRRRVKQRRVEPKLYPSF
jgi:hypothetical protein